MWPWLHSCIIRLVFLDVRWQLLPRFCLSILAYIARSAILCLSSWIPESCSRGWPRRLGELLFPFPLPELSAPDVLFLGVDSIVFVRLPMDSVGRSYCLPYFGVGEGWHRWGLRLVSLSRGSWCLLYLLLLGSRQLYRLEWCCLCYHSLRWLAVSRYWIVVVLG